MMQLVCGRGPHPRGILLPWDTGPCLGTYVVVTTEGAPGIEWMGATDAALHPTVPAPRPAPPPKTTGLSVNSRRGRRYPGVKAGHCTMGSVLRRAHGSFTVVSGAMDEA